MPRIELGRICDKHDHGYEGHDGFSIAEAVARTCEKEADKRLQQMALNYDTIIQCDKALHKEKVKEIVEEIERSGILTTWDGTEDEKWQELKKKLGV